MKPAEKSPEARKVANWHVDACVEVAFSQVWRHLMVAFGERQKRYWWIVCILFRNPRNPGSSACSSALFGSVFYFLFFRQLPSLKWELKRLIARVTASGKEISKEVVSRNVSHLTRWISWLWHPWQIGKSISCQKEHRLKKWGSICTGGNLCDWKV